MTKLSGCFR